MQRKTSLIFTLALMMIAWASMFWFIQQQQITENTQTISKTPNYRLDMLNEQCKFQIKKNLLFTRVGKEFETNCLEKKEHYGPGVTRETISALKQLVINQNMVSIQKEYNNLIIPIEEFEMVMDKLNFSSSFKAIEWACNGSTQCMSVWVWSRGRKSVTYVL